MKFAVGSARQWYLGYSTWPRPSETRLPQLYGRHECECGNCDPALVPAAERLGVGHFSVHLGDWKLEPLFGEKCLDHCVEILCGPEGWALCYSTPHHMCARCLKGVCCYRIYGPEFSVTNIEYKDTKS